MRKPTAVIDKSLLHPICELADNRRRDECLRFLTENFTLYATPMLIEEIAANYFQPTKDISRDLAGMMLRAASRFRLMEHPLELVFQEVVLKRDISNNFELNSAMAAKFKNWISDLDGNLPELEHLFRERLEYKEWRMEKIKQFQAPLKDPANRTPRNFQDLAAFIRNTQGSLDTKLANPNAKTAYLRGLLIPHLNKCCPDAVARTEEAFSDLVFENAPFAHDCVLAYALYLSAPVTRIGPKAAGKANPFVLSGSQFNNEEDEEYVTCALLCDYLLTCDEGMQRMADIHRTTCLSRRGYKSPGAAILVPRLRINQLERLLGPLVSA